ncbi:large ribosomal subunit protein eL6-like [Artemia franciscana]|nr:hypothetical protein QYM36_014603 [Artemia franciscana]KAK2709030.1 hypothetical protein QYM36_014603 [Artemia franciscana]
MAGKKAATKPAPPSLASGKYVFSKAEAARKYLEAKRRQLPKSVKLAKKAQKKKPLVIEKKIGGDKNGGTRLVSTRKPPQFYPINSRQKRFHRRLVNNKNPPKIRKSLQPGTILILLAGVNRGKRVVLLKALKSGLLLVSGPLKVNRVPLRRVHQKLVIATSTRIDISNVKVPEHINDTYFRRHKVKKEAKEGDIFASKPERYTPTEQRKKDQAEVDVQLLKAIKAQPDAAMLVKYLRTIFGLKNNMIPHKLKF